MKKEITDIFDISKTKEKISIICTIANEDCKFSQQMKIRIKDNLSSRLKSIWSYDGLLSDTGYGGCEEDNVFIHHPKTRDSWYFDFDLLSRARKRLVMMMSEYLLDTYFPFLCTWNVLTNHEENCKNKVCQENGWSNKKVIEVHEVNALKDYEYTDSDLHDSDSSLYDSDSENNLKSDLSDCE